MRQEFDFQVLVLELLAYFFVGFCDFLIFFLNFCYVLEDSRESYTRLCPRPEKR